MVPVFWTGVSVKSVGWFRGRERLLRDDSKASAVAGGDQGPY
jgi:hypothetical protein